MGKLHFINLPPSIDARHNLFTQTFVVEKLPRDICIVFPYRNRKVDGFTNSFSQRADIIDELNSTYKDCLKICWSSTTLMSNMPAFNMNDLFYEYVDLCVGQEHCTRLPLSKYFRLPTWCLELFGLFPTIEQIANKIVELESLRQANPFLRKEFMACAVHIDRHSTAKGIVEILNSTMQTHPYFRQLPIKFPGNCCHNDDRLANVFKHDLVTYLRQFTFALCSEKVNMESVVSENLAKTLKAGCIPIYWGDLTSERKYFNQQALVEFDVTRRTEFPNKLRTVMVEHEKFVQQPIFNPGAAEKIFADIYAPLAVYFEELLGSDLMLYLQDDRLGSHKQAQFTAQDVNQQAWQLFIQEHEKYSKG